RILAALAFIGNIVITLAYALIAWRLWDGMIDKMSFGQSSFILQIPVWWGYAASMPGAAAAVAVSAFTVLRSLNEALGSGEKAHNGYLHE
ncbi:MAG TPA: TRAP transporter small permease subunit, partial [Alphaproteobacteria bacterium]|nr:TRAP transporter small permease subunit [Alphaproteobacteria bacterium]